MLPRAGTPILISTTINAMPQKVIFAIVLTSLATATMCAPSHAQVGIEERVRRLGRPGDSDDLADVQVLSQAPYEAVGALIRELHPIPNPEHAGVNDAPSTEHLISTLAALRYITGGSDFYTIGGKDFCAKTKWEFGSSEGEKNRRYWLYFDHPNCVSFFSIWPSRYRVYLAPVDAQQEIIRQWRQWYATDGGAYRFTSPPDSPEKRSLLWQCARAVYSPPHDTHE
jgi:hypothetical protein